MRPRTPDPLANDPDDQRDTADQDRLDDLGRKIEAARGTTPETQPVRPGSVGIAYRFASELIAGLLVGVLLGWGFDRLFGTRPWGLLVFLILGLAAAMTNVIRAAQRINAALPGAKENENDG